MINFRKRYPNNIFLLTIFSLLLSIGNTSFGQVKDAEIQKIAQDIGIPSLQIAHTKGGKTNLYSYGVKNYADADHINQNTRFQAASLTKVITTYAFFRLMDKGLILLDKPLLAYYKYDRLIHTKLADKITARMILTHRSGLLNWEGDVPSQEWRATPLTLQFEPGTDYMYSGEGFYFLQETLEHITGKSFQDIVEQEVIIPLGLNNSHIAWADSLEKNAAYGHYSLEKPRSLGKYAKPNAAYTLYTTASDYSKFVQKALLEGFGLKKETQQLMLAKASEAKKHKELHPTDQYVPCAMGLRMQINEKGTAYWHTGSNPGFRCFFITYPKTKETLVAFMNTDTAFPAMKKLMELFLDKNQTFWAYDWREGELD